MAQIFVSTWLKYSLTFTPNIVLSQTGSIGHYGHLRREYLKEHRPVIYNALVLSERLFPHLQEVEQRAHDRMDELIELLKKERMIDEALKARDPMRWVGEMNNIRACADGWLDYDDAEEQRVCQ